jgi:hypothetical protein
MKELISINDFAKGIETLTVKQLNDLHGGKSIADQNDTVTFICKDTLDAWTCPDTCSQGVGDGLYGTDCDGVTIIG